MTDGHQQLPVIYDTPLDDMLMWAVAVQAMVNEKNRMLAASGMT